MAASDGLFCILPTQSITVSLLFEGKNDLKTGTEAKSIYHDPIDFHISHKSMEILGGNLEILKHFFVVPLYMLNLVVGSTDCKDNGSFYAKQFLKSVPEDS